MSEPTADAKLRTVLEELSMGRLTVDEALEQVKQLRAATAAPANLAGLMNSALKTRVRGNTASAGWIAGGILALIGTIFLCVGGIFGWKIVEFAQGSERVVGKVVRMVHGHGNGNGSKPVVRYVVGGKPYEVEGTISSSPPSFRVGDEATVIYKTDDPNRAQIDSFVERWLFLLVFGGIGALLALIGWSILLVKLVKKLAAAATMLGPVESERFTIE